MCATMTLTGLFSEVKETITSKEKWLNALINSMLYYCRMGRSLNLSQTTALQSLLRRLTMPSRLPRGCPSSCTMERNLTTGKPRLLCVLQMTMFNAISRLDAYRINTASYYFTSFAFLPLLAAAKSVGNFSEPGNIINVASISGMTATSQGGQFSYNSSK